MGWIGWGAVILHFRCDRRALDTGLGSNSRASLMLIAGIASVNIVYFV